MTRKVSAICALLFALSILLAGCGCKHEWQAATCITPKTCSLCQDTEGEALGHSWVDATYTTYKICSVCQTTEGEKLTAKEAFAANPCEWLYGTWSGRVYISGSSIGNGDFPTKVKLVCTVTFNEDGTYKETFKMGNEAEFISGVESYYEDLLYEDLMADGFSKAEADAVVTLTYGMDIKTYAKKLASKTDWASLMQSAKTGVYFVHNEQLYMGDSWSGTFQANDYSYSQPAKCLSIEYLSKKYPTLLLLRS